MKRTRVIERVVGVCVLAGVVCAVLAIAGVFASSPTPVFDDAAPSASDNSSGRAANCSAVAAKDRVVAYWDSEMGGSSTIPEGVTHLVLSAATVDEDGSVAQSLQASDAAVDAIISSLHKRCISVLVALRSRNVSEVVQAEPAGLAKGVAALLDKFSFDGVVVHDDADAASNFSAAAVTSYMTALAEVLRPDNRTLAYDARLLEADAAACASTKCFPPALAPLVDWVNVFGFNAAQTQDEANTLSAAAVGDGGIFSTWVSALGDAGKVAVVVSAAGGATWGPDLSNATIASFTDWAKTRGGVGVWTASSDLYSDFGVLGLVLDTRQGFRSAHTAPPNAPASPRPTKASTVFCHSPVAYSVRAGDSAWSIVTKVCRKTTNTKCSRDGVWLYRTSSLALCPSDLGPGDKVTVCCGVN